MNLETQQRRADAVTGLVRRGVELEAAHRPEQALDCLTEAVRQSPDNAVANLHLAVVLAEMGRFAEAMPPLRKALDLQPNSPAFHLIAGRVHFDRQAHEDAGNEFSCALDMSPQNDLARGMAILNNWESGDAGAPLKLDPDDMPDSDIFMARLLMLVEKEMEGRDFGYEDAGQTVPLLDRPRVAWLLWRAAGAMKSGDCDRASEYASITLEMRPGLPAATRLMEECRRAALERARRDVQEQPQSAEAHLALAQHLRDAEDYASAARELAEACRLFAEAGRANNANNPEVSRLEGMILYGLGCPTEALERLNAGAEPGMTMPMTNYAQGLCHLALGHRMQCLEAFGALVGKAWWAVPLRFREYLAWRARQGEART